MKVRFFAIAFVVLCIVAGLSVMPVQAAAGYDCGFEVSEGFTADLDITGQGTPAWTHSYTNWESGGNVVSSEQQTGAQSMWVGGYKSCVLTLPAVTRAQWFEFAIKPVFDGDANNDMIRIMTTRGGAVDVQGIRLTLLKNVGDITLTTTDSPVSLGAFTPNAWQTLSFKQYTYEYLGNTYFSGVVDAYVNGVFKGTFNASNGDYNGLQTMIFTTAEDSWALGGAAYIDNIHVGDSMVFTAVGTPTFTPPGGKYGYGTTQNVAIACDTAGATIRYTTDGTEPTPTNGTVIASGSTVAVSTPLTLKAKAWKAGLPDSGTKTAAYSFYAAGTVYDCGFETAEGFAGGALTGQGMPAWGERYLSGYDAGGSVDNTMGYGGSSQSGYINGYSTSWVKLDAVTRAPWVEFAFRTNFAGGGSGTPDDTIWIRSLRGPVGEMYGFDFSVVKKDARIILHTSSGDVDLGPCPDQTWKTISFQHDIYAPTGVYTGSFNVYVDNQLIGHYTSVSTNAYSGMQTIIFSAASPPWTNNGALSVDNIHVGDESNFVLGAVATPSFSIPAGKYGYGTTQNVAISCVTAGATVRYTTDGSEPTPSNGTVIASGSTVAVSTALTLKAKAWKTGYTDSATASAAYSFYAQGTVYDCGFEAGEFFASGALSGQGAPAWEGYYSSGYDAGGILDTTRAYAGSQSAYIEGYSTSRVTLAEVTRAPWFEFAFRTNFVGGGNNVPESQVWMRTTRGLYWDAVGVNMWVIKQDARIMLSTSGGVVDLGPCPDQEWQTISFQHDVSGGYYNGGFNVFVNSQLIGHYAVGSAYNGLQTMVFSTNSPSWTKNGALSVDSIHVGDSSTFVSGQFVVPPAFSVPAGTYYLPQTVTITCETAGATIRYTTNGTEPTPTNGTVIASGSSVTVSTPLTLKAKAWKTGYTTSITTSAAYAEFSYVATPTFAPPAGKYPGGSTQNVAISCVTPGATIRYTTDGTEPTTSNGTVIASGSTVAISTALTLKAKAWKTGYTVSDTATGAYSFFPADTVYDCGFEAGEGFALGAVAGQGIPAWSQSYTNWEGSGVVEDLQKYAGAQAMNITGYQSGVITLAARTAVPWVEFSFMPAFDAGPEHAADAIRVITTRAEVSNVVGIDLRMVNSTGQIELSTKDNGWVALAPFTNNAWHTISFKHDTYSSMGTGYYYGSVSVYINGEYKGWYMLPNGLPQGGDYSGLQTIVFTTTDGSWTKGGSLYVDNVHIGMNSKLANSRPNNIPETNSVVVDGSLSDWADAQWAPLDYTYTGHPTDIQSAYYSAKWSSVTNKIYFAVKVKDMFHYLNPEYVDWNILDDVELYVRTNGDTGDFSDYQEPAQQYTLGFTGVDNGLWSAIGYPISPSHGVSPVPANANFQCAGTIDGDWLYYEAAVTPFQYYGGLRGTSSQVTTLVAGQLVGLDVVAATTTEAYDFGMLSENNMTSKSSNYGSFGLHQLIAAPAPVTIGAAKSKADGASVVCSGTVSAVFTDYLYIESSDRAYGIRVNKTGHGRSVGQNVDVSGTVGTLASGERYIEASGVSLAAGSGNILPLAMTNKALGGGSFALQSGVEGGVGLNNIGLLIRTSGKVTTKGTGWFMVDDGSGVSVKVYGTVPGGTPYVSVTGASSCEKDGSSKIQRAIQATSVQTL